MYDEDRQKIHKWFKEHKDYSTYHSYSPNKERDEYVISAFDVDDFCDFLRENMPDMIGIPCMVCSDGIYFKRPDLDNARFL